MSKEQIEKIRVRNHLYSQLRSIFSEFACSLNKESIVLFSYLAYLQKKNELDSAVQALEASELKDFSNYMKANFDTSAFNLCEYLSEAYDESQLKALILHDNLFDLRRNKPELISKLAMKLLDIRISDSVFFTCLDFCDVPQRFSEISPEMKLDCYCHDAASYIVFLIRNEILRSDFNAFIDFDEYDLTDYDKIFYYKKSSLSDRHASTQANGMSELLGGENYVETVARVSLMLDKVSAGGKFIKIVDKAFLQSLRQERICAYFIESGKINAVIALPNFFNSERYMIIFTEEANDCIRFVNAKDFDACALEGGQNIDKICAEILLRLRENSSNSVLVSKKKLEDNSFSLKPEDYFTSAQTKDSVKFGTLIKNIRLGKNLRSAELDEISTSKKTNFKALNYQNISDGLIDEQLTSLKVLDPCYEKFCLEDGDFIFAKHGTSFKFANASVPSGQKVLLTGNFYIIKLDTKKVDPYYLQAYLTSADGQALLLKSAQGMRIKVLSKKDLRALSIPLPPMAKQKKIAIKFKRHLDEIAACRKKLSKLRQGFTF
ncbi:MAG: restriction endonuclease subunit S [Eggerthellaceae bacterium]|nr:restriction endonuclease subunit S [Eggerthellaceae bacterium]